MALWIFQALVNILLFGAALMWLLSRKRARFLEAQCERVEREVESLKLALRRDGLALASAAEVSKNPAGAKLAPHLPSPTSFVASHSLSPRVQGGQGSLVEKRVDQPTRKTLSKAETADAYDKASLLLSRGMALREIARVTGLSMAELQLMGKVSQRNQ
jgi:hypothetical protein